MFQVLVKPMVGKLFEQRGYTALLKVHQAMSDLADGAEVSGRGRECRDTVMGGLDKYCDAAEALPGGGRGAKSVFQCVRALQVRFHMTKSVFKSPYSHEKSVLTCVRALQEVEPKALLSEFSIWLQVSCALDTDRGYGGYGGYGG